MVVRHTICEGATTLFHGQQVQSAVKEFRCGELVPGCGAAFHGESEIEILEQIAAHARDDHGMYEVPPEVVDTIRAGITDRHPRSVAGAR
jgi:predicted small metal-binding protein